MRPGHRTSALDVTTSREPFGWARWRREMPPLTRRHLCPREHGGTVTVRLCSGCHKQVHALFTNRTLARELDTLEKLRGEPTVRRYAEWASKQPPGRIRVRRSRARR